MRFKFYITSILISVLMISCQKAKSGIIAEKNNNLNLVGGNPPNIIVILTDDHGYADVGAQKQSNDIRTPQIDLLAAGGARFTSAYVTAPVCAPSRIGLITGMYQQKFGVDNNANAGNFPQHIQTLPQRLQKAGYTTGLVGKAHFGRPIATMGFDYYFMHQTSPWEPVYLNNFDKDGRILPKNELFNLKNLGQYRIEEETKKAELFIEKNRNEPFFLYLAYTAPHVPMEAPADYMDRFKDVKDKDRQLCLAMLSAVDDGVGRIMSMLEKYSLKENTLVIFLSDNGGVEDKTNEGYDASLNIPLLGEKGLLLEGGIRIPWIMYWQGKIKKGQKITAPVISLDISATVLNLAKAKDMSGLDGIDLMPWVLNGKKSNKDRPFFWYTRGQEAIRYGKWKMMRRSDKSWSYLVNIEDDISEQNNLAVRYPEVVKQLEAELDKWILSNGVVVDPVAPPVLDRRLRFYTD